LGPALFALPLIRTNEEPGSFCQPLTGRENMKRKEDVISFKVDASLKKAMEDISNRSEFIRNAILASLESACPLCNGTGILNPQQKRHMEYFLAHHSLEKCRKCHEVFLKCHK
jgi:hypothetical protein